MSYETTSSRYPRTANGHGCGLQPLKTRWESCASGCGGYGMPPSARRRAWRQVAAVMMRCLRKLRVSSGVNSSQKQSGSRASCPKSPGKVDSRREKVQGAINAMVHCHESGYPQGTLQLKIQRSDVQAYRSNRGQPGGPPLEVTSSDVYDDPNATGPDGGSRMLRHLR